MDLSPMGKLILEKRYLMRDRQGRPTEAPEDLFRRVARAIAAVDEEPEEAEARFFAMMRDQTFMPNSPTLMNAGRPGGILPGCFVLPLDDSLEAIYDTKSTMVRILQMGGGVGMSFGRLRPDGDVTSTGGLATGPVSFLRSFSNDLTIITRGGRRRGAGMAMLPVWHADVLAFAGCKASLAEDLQPIYDAFAPALGEAASKLHHMLAGLQIPNFNLSVAITDAFMAALEAGEEVTLLNPRTMRPTARMPASEIWQRLVENAWESGDPGLFFIDRANADHPLRHLGPIEATNPCGEQPLMPYESCNLGSINLAKFYRAGDLDWEGLGEVVDWAVRFLDNVIDVTAFPNHRSAAVSRRNRKIGLGVMGFADLLVQLGVPYDSDEGVAWGHRVMAFIQERSHEASRRLAESRGVFPSYPDSKWDKKGLPLRNGCTTTVAPTGTISLFANCSAGLEPIYALAYRRYQAETEMPEVYPLFEQIGTERGFYSPEVAQAVAAQHGSCQGIEAVPAELRRVFVTAHEIAPEWHVRMQAAFQANSDASVSKTVNTPPESTPDDVDAAYRLAWELGCKGITIYREGSRPGQVLTRGP